VKLNERIGRVSVRSTAISNAVCRPVEGVGGKQSSQSVYNHRQFDTRLSIVCVTQRGKSLAEQTNLHPNFDLPSHSRSKLMICLSVGRVFKFQQEAGAIFRRETINNSKSCAG